MDRVKRIWYLSPMRAAKVQASLRIRAVSPEPSLLAHTSSESRGTFRQKARSLAPLNGWACAVKICHDGMIEDTNSLDGAHMTVTQTSLDTRRSSLEVTILYYWAETDTLYYRKYNFNATECSAMCSYCGQAFKDVFFAHCYCMSDDSWNKKYIFVLYSGLFRTAV